MGGRVDHRAVNVLRAEHATELGRRFVENVLDLGARATSLFEGESRGQSADAAADNGDALHEVRRECSCTNRARFFTFSTGVSGRMPWPLLQLWPSRPRARRRMSSSRAPLSFQSGTINTD